MELTLQILEGLVSCPLKGEISAYDECLDCPWLNDYSLESPEPFVVCEPPSPQSIYESRKKATIINSHV
ncbi:hypothetical protein LSG31_01115 [Fodinisporobacter ferrooxydans]|uniref:Cysteine-rich CPCC domain-containing protein n=1 Tax=Fodinisporobacter ferrooxydans TaxID=2901836 RepID=A0ABY4CLP9_9BACL|nr:hypothetical protein LSG31_01115 [Alicyclobacillaceae bacterium MYW30-H2]